MPSVDRVLGTGVIVSLQQVYGRTAVREAVRSRLEESRRNLTRFPENDDEVARDVESALIARFGPPLQRVINATGILVHTNLGRSPLPSWAADRLAGLVDAYCDLEFDLSSGHRGDRNHRVEALLCALTEAPAALVVNNNAAAVFLSLMTFAKGKEVLISRGEMVEIGGSFRVPEIIEASGASLVEVGTTNRTRITDYQQAITDSAAVLLKVNPSNYRIEGFTASVPTEELVALGQRRGLRVIVDEGSGLLVRSSRDQLNDHQSLAELVQCGVDLACGSGDKLMGGPQAGIMVGTREMIASCRKSPMYRALRPSRLTLLVLRMVLEGHLRGAEFPLQSLWPENSDLRRRLTTLQEKVGGSIVERDAFVGGGSAAQRGISGPVLAIEGGEALQVELRTADPSVVTYVRDDLVHVDLRTVNPRDEDQVVSAFAAVRALD